MLNRFRLLTGLLILVFGVSACANDTDTEETTVTTEETMDDGATMASGTVVDVAMGDDRFSTLVTAIQAAGLVETLQGDGPYTVLAPTNAAFDALPDGKLDELLMEENRQDLIDLLTYHVIPAKAMATDVSGMSSAGSVQGEDITIATTDGMVKLNGTATVIAADIPASNGVIHAIDTVIMPPSMQ